MNWDLEVSSFGLVLLVVLGILLFALMRWLRRLVHLIPMTRSRRETLERALPVAETLVSLVYLLSAVPMVFDDHPQYSPIGLALILLGFAVGCWFAIRDFVNGAFLKSGGLLEVGDHVRLGDVDGRLTRLGYRTLSVETANGGQAIVPYSRVTRDSIVRTPVVSGMWRHAFTVTPQPDAPARDAREQIRRAALNHHWSSIAHEPQIHRDAEGVFEVVVYALAPERAAAIQAAVEAAVAGTQSAIPRTNRKKP